MTANTPSDACGGRWTTFDAKVFGVKLPTDVPASIQERAYTTPIWYSPG